MKLEEIVVDEKIHDDVIDEERWSPIQVVVVEMEKMTLVKLWELVVEFEMEEGIGEGFLFWWSGEEKKSKVEKDRYL